MLLRPYQEQAINSLWDCWKNNPKSNPIIVAPVGAGKTFIISSIVDKISKKHPNFRFLIVTHTKELVEQNKLDYESLTKERAGLYSASLNSKTIARVTFASIQSIYKKKDLDFGMIIIDECHRLSNNDDSMYQQLINNLKNKNSTLKILGLSGTPYRLDSGSLVGRNNLFTEVCYDISVIDLINQKYLSPLLSYKKQSVDLSTVKTSGYDYNQIDLENAFNKDKLIETHVKEITEIGLEKNRNSWLIFCSGIEHAKKVSEEFKKLGITSAVVTGDTAAFERDSIIKDFKSGKIKALCNVNVLTTGFNAPNVDMLVMLRATKSTSLYVQMAGRGTRLFEGKKNCIVLDYGNNVERHGPIDCINVKNKKDREKVSIQAAPHKTCPRCSCAVASRVLICPSCEFPFPDSTIQLDIESSDAKILSEIEEYEVKELNVKLHKKTGSPPMVKIEFVINPYKTFYDFLCFEHQGFASREACRKWVKYTGEIPPKETDSALARAHEIKKINTVKVKKSGKYWQVIDFTN